MEFSDIIFSVWKQWGYQNSPKCRDYSDRAKIVSKFLILGNWVWAKEKNQRDLNVAGLFAQMEITQIIYGNRVVCIKENVWKYIRITSVSSNTRFHEREGWISLINDVICNQQNFWIKQGSKCAAAKRFRWWCILFTTISISTTRKCCSSKKVTNIRDLFDFYSVV